MKEKNEMKLFLTEYLNKINCCLKKNDFVYL